MLTIKDLKDNTINLDDYQSEYKLVVVSKDKKNIPRAFDVTLVTSDFIEVKKYGTTLVINIDVDNIQKEEIIMLTNVLKEKLIIKVLPNSFVTMKKTYKFKITKRIYQEDGSLKVKILSLVNDMEIGWRCTYDGKPISYSIEPLSSDKSCYVTIKPIDKVLSEFDTLFEFTQDKSNETIRLSVHNTLEGIKKKVD